MQLDGRTKTVIFVAAASIALGGLGAGAWASMAPIAEDTANPIALAKTASVDRDAIRVTVNDEAETSETSNPDSGAFGLCTAYLADGLGQKRSSGEKPDAAANGDSRPNANANPKANANATGNVNAANAQARATARSGGDTVSGGLERLTAAASAAAALTVAVETDEIGVYCAGVVSVER